MKLTSLLANLRVAMSLRPGRHCGWLVGSVLLAALDMLDVAAMPLHRSMGPEQTFFVTPKTPRSVKAAEGRVPAHILVESDERAHSRLMRRLRMAWRNVFSVSPPPGFAAPLRKNKEARQALAEADVVDVQWEHTQRLLRLLRRLAPCARFVRTFRDVVSQQKARELAGAHSGRDRLKAAAGLQATDSSGVRVSCGISAYFGSRAVRGATR